MQTLVFELLTRWQNNKARTLSQQYVAEETSVIFSQKRLKSQQGISLDLQTIDYPWYKQRQVMLEKGKLWAENLLWFIYTRMAES